MYAEEKLLFNLAIFFDIESEKKPQYKRKAIRLFKKLARKGHADSQYMYALMCAIGDGMRRNERKERYWFEKEAKQGRVDAQYSLGTLLTRKEETQ